MFTNSKILNFQKKSKFLKMEFGDIPPLATVNQFNYIGRVF